MEIIDIKVREEDFKEARSNEYVYGVRIVRTENEEGLSSKLNTRYIYVIVILGEQIEDKSNRAKLGAKIKLFKNCEVRYALRDEDLDYGKFVSIAKNQTVRILYSSPWRY